MESKLTLNNILYCYNNLKKHRSDMFGFELGKHLGYLEAGLANFGFLDTVMNGNIREVKRQMKPATAWYKKPKLESYEGAIIRMTENMFKENGINF